MDRLREMRLVREIEVRKGVKNIILLTGTFTKFKDLADRSIADWTELDHQLLQLNQLVKNDEIEPLTAGSTVAFLIYRAASITGNLAFIADETFPIEAKRGLLKFSINRFNSFLNEVMILGKQHPSIGKGFEKISGEILETARRTLRKLKTN